MVVAQYEVVPDVFVYGESYVWNRNKNHKQEEQVKMICIIYSKSPRAASHQTSPSRFRG